MTKTLQLLAQAADLEPEFVEFANELKILRPSEAMEAMLSACIDLLTWMDLHMWKGSHWAWYNGTNQKVYIQYAPPDENGYCKPTYKTFAELINEWNNEKKEE